MTRYEANMKLLDILSSYFKAYPDMRFGQALYNLGIATHRDTNSVLQQENLVDIFFEESTDTLALFKPLNVDEISHIKGVIGQEPAELSELLRGGGSENTTN